MTNVATHYGAHPSSELRQLFRQSLPPYQGQNPEIAKIIIFGLDANYSPEIAKNKAFFKRIVEYHENAMEFWHEHKVHHPFLLDEYPYNKTTGGVPYHRRFSWMGLSDQYAESISFVELLDIPTTGRTGRKIFWDLFNAEHAKRLDRIVCSGDHRLVLLSKSLTDTYMSKARKNMGVFSWLPNHFSLGEMKRIGEIIIYGGPHFSSTTYKKSVFHELGVIIKNFCEENKHYGVSP